MDDSWSFAIYHVWQWMSNECNTRILFGRGDYILVESMWHWHTTSWHLVENCNDLCTPYCLFVQSYDTLLVATRISRIKAMSRWSTIRYPTIDIDTPSIGVSISRGSFHRWLLWYSDEVLIIIRTLILRSKAPSIWSQKVPYLFVLISLSII